MAAIVKALKQAAAYLPAGRLLDEAVAKRRALEAEMRQVAGPGGVLPEQRRFTDRFRRLQLQIYDADKALGLASCLGRPPPPPSGG
jgi:hypothetical protein